MVIGNDCHAPTCLTLNEPFEFFFTSVMPSLWSRSLVGVIHQLLDCIHGLLHFVLAFSDQRLLRLDKFTGTNVLCQLLVFLLVVLIESLRSLDCFLVFSVGLATRPMRTFDVHL